MSRRLIATFALIVFTLTGLGLPAFASIAQPAQATIEAPCHEMATVTKDHKADKSTPKPHSDCDDIGCHCALSHCPATLIPPHNFDLSEPKTQRMMLNALPQNALTATAPDTLKRPPRA